MPGMPYRGGVGVIGITGLTLTGGLSPATTGDVPLGRQPAQPYELLYLGSADLGVSAGG